MIISGLVILAFLALHFYDFWIPEIEYKYVQFKNPDSLKYFHELKEKFYGQTTRTIIYCISFVLLGLHLNHGLSSSVQSIGISNKNSESLEKLANLYSFVVSVGFSSIAVYHYFVH